MKEQNVEKTKPMGIANSGFLLERLGADCHPLQLLREYTQNSIDSILRTKEKTGRIVWDYAPDFLKRGQLKLTVTDTGEGMTPQEMVLYLNHLSSSGSVQSLTENYGLGAKISAASRNPFGVVYRSWKNGKGFELTLWKDPTTGQYGIKKVKSGELCSPLKDELKKGTARKSIIEGHGTSVVFLGRNEGDNTAEFIGEHGGTSKFKIKYLNDRYWVLPQGVSVMVRELHPSDKHSQLREVKGQKHFLEQYKDASGKVELKNAVAHWWITNETHYPAVHDYATANGFVSAVFQNELYDMPTYNKGRIGRLQEFGVSFGHKNVFIVVEPKLKNLTTDTARQYLIDGEKPLPWSDWAEEFRAKIPLELMTWIESQYEVSKTSNAEIERLAEIETLFERTSRFIASPVGTVEQVFRSALPKKGNDDDKPPKKKKVEFETTGEKKPREPKTKLTEETQNQKKGKLKLVWPSVRWVLPVEDEALTDRAAKYIPALHEIHANKDFRVFKDMERAVLASRQKSDSKVLTQAVSDKVFEWYGQFLKEIVMGVKALGWAEKDTTKALSEEALTAAVSMRYAVLQCIEQDLGKKLTSRIEKLAEAPGIVDQVLPPILPTETVQRIDA